MLPLAAQLCDQSATDSQRAQNLCVLQVGEGASLGHKFVAIHFWAQALQTAVLAP